jgi:hypothetical protein
MSSLSTVMIAFVVVVMLDERCIVLGKYRSSKESPGSGTIA